MLRTRTARVLLDLTVMMSLVSIGTAADASAIRWEEGMPEGTRQLVVEIGDADPDFAVAVTPGGIRINLSARIELQGSDLENVEVTAGDATTIIDLKIPGATIGGISTGDGEISCLIGIPLPMATSGSGYSLGIGDQISIQIYRDKDLSGAYQIGQDGTVNLPLVGPIRAAGLSESELARNLTSVLSDYLVDPQVSVTILTFESQFIHVTGAVARTSKIALRPGKSIKDILSEAGVSLIQGQKIELQRTGPKGNLTVTLDGSDLDGAGIPTPQSGDVLRVLEPDYIFIRGEVRRPGKHILTPKLTLQQAIVLAEGLTDWASKKEIHILRNIDGESTVDKTYNLKKIESGRSPDPLLHPGDLILVKRRIL